MRIEAIDLSWFRGAGEKFSLGCPRGASVVVYGANGAGKSTLVDALEVVSSGRVEHLAHEYSGTHQLVALRNTEAPAGAVAEIAVTFLDCDSKATARIAAAGPPRLGSPAQCPAFTQWEKHRHVLRQDRLSHFIHAKKGEKYTALLPILGLDDLKRTADNLQTLCRRFREAAQIDAVSREAEGLARRAKEVLGSISRGRLSEAAEELTSRYPSAGGDAEASLSDLLPTVESAIERHVRDLEPDRDRFDALRSLVELRLEELAAEAAARIRDSDRATDALIQARIKVLEETSQFVEVSDRLTETPEVGCPACGRRVSVSDLSRHVEGELRQLHDERARVDVADKARRALADALRHLKDLGVGLEGWLSESPAWNPLSPLVNAALEHKRSFDIAPLVAPLGALSREAAGALALSQRPDLQLYLADRETLDALSSAIEANRLSRRKKALERVARELDVRRRDVLSQIKACAEAALDDISSDVQHLWSLLHPGEPIDEVRLYTFPDSDKAIDVSLRFFGHHQPSPRNTLSEGHRNSLGLCIFLALARRAEDRLPLVLDDIVSSLDREHRGRIVDLLVSELSDRQILLFTHDREWFGELRRRLPAGSWTFRRLRPFEDPAIGLRWDPTSDRLDEARAFLPDRPEAAANSARAYMDGELGAAAEKLDLLLAYRRGDRNDRRTSVEFLQALRSAAKNRFKRQREGKTVAFGEAGETWKEAEGLLITAGNRGSHDGSVTVTEATDLIEACEEALAVFRCPGCSLEVWRFRDQARDRLSCRCGDLEWRC